MLLDVSKMLLPLAPVVRLAIFFFDGFPKEIVTIFASGEFETRLQTVHRGADLLRQLNL